MMAYRSMYATIQNMLSPVHWVAFHNEIRDLTANLMAEVCHNVSIEQTLQPITGETFSTLSANTEDGARSDIARSGWFLGWSI